MKSLSMLVGTVVTAFMLASELSAVAQPMSQQLTAQQKDPAAGSENNVKINPEEFQRFARAFQVVQSIQNQSQQQVRQAIREQGITVKEYKRFLRQQQQTNNNPSNLSNFSQEKQRQFKQANARIEEIQKTTQGKIKQAIAKEGLQVKRFDKIWKAVKNNPELQQQLLEELQK